MKLFSVIVINIVSAVSASEVIILKSINSTIKINVTTNTIMRTTMVAGNREARREPSSFPRTTEPTWPTNLPEIPKVLMLCLAYNHLVLQPSICLQFYIFFFVEMYLYSKI